MRLILVLTVVFLLGIGLTPQNPPSPAGMTNEECLKALERALKALDAIEITGTVQNFDLLDGTGGPIRGGTDPIRFRTLMTRDQLRCDTYRNDELLASFAWFNGRFQEYRPHLPHRPLMEFDAPLSCGTDDTVLKQGYECHIAYLFFTWLLTDDPESLVGSWSHYFIDGTRLPDEQIDGRQCLVFEWTRRFGDEVLVRHQIGLDRETFLPASWRTWADGVRREDVYRVRPIEMPSTKDAWRLSVPGRERPVDRPDALLSDRILNHPVTHNDK